VNWAASRRWLMAPRSIGQSAALACLLEASAPKAGNVHPAAAFVDMDFADFLVSALSIATVFDSTAERRVGELVLAGVSATAEQLDVNTNLGTILLLAPLAKALCLWHSEHAERPTAADLHASVTAVLDQLDASDAASVYAAIRRAKPGGLSRAAAHDVHGAPPSDLRAAMAVASEVDAVARQYVHNFDDVCGLLVSWLRGSLGRGLDLLEAASELQLRWLAEHGDGLIVRKAGAELATEAQHLANIALQEWLETGQRGVRWNALDTFLRADGHCRNPGTTADLIAAALFVLLTTDADSRTTE
jgi:triphosphoribosyl-dephospho-CoA synthase